MQNKLHVELDIDLNSKWILFKILRSYYFTFLCNLNHNFINIGVQQWDTLVYILTVIANTAMQHDVEFRSGALSLGLQSLLISSFLKACLTFFEKNIMVLPF